MSVRTRERRPQGDDEPKKTRSRPSKDYLEPLSSKVKSRKFVVYDIESKADDTQDPGFTRPFMVGVYDGARD